MIYSKMCEECRKETIEWYKQYQASGKPTYHITAERMIYMATKAVCTKCPYPKI